MEKANSFFHLHKQRLYSLIIAALSLITLFLPWLSAGFWGSSNGVRGWGIFSLIGVAGVLASTFIGDKTMPFDHGLKKIVLGSFAAITLGALIFLLTKNSNYGALIGAGAGLWICLLTGLAGLAFLVGFIKFPEKRH